MRMLVFLARIIDASNEILGKAVAWLALLMVLIQFVVVVMRYTFGIGSVVMQESIVYMHATLFLVVAGYTLLHNGHVRCDIFYAAATAKRKALVDLVGVFLFLFPMCALIGLSAWPYVVSAWTVREGSPEGTLGIPAVYLLKSTILAFAVMVGLQGLALAVRALSVLFGIKAHAESDAHTGGHEE